MKFCEGNLTVLDVWVDSGINPCFFDSLSILIQFLIVIVLGSIEWIIYCRYGAPKDAALIPKSNKKHKAQIGTHAAIPIVAIIQFCLHLSGIIKPFSGYNILLLLSSILHWIFALFLLHKERMLELPVTPNHGHGIVLLMFWSFNFLMSHLTIVSYKSPLWFWHLNTMSDRVSLGFFVTEYLLKGLAFGLGLKAPGLPTIQQRHRHSHGLLINEDTNDPRPGERNDGHPESASVGSTWRNVGKKLGQLLPYLWPKGQYGLQFRVFLCILILVAGRVVNLYVPIYYKWIVNALSIPRFCWDLILVYSGLRFVQGSAMSGGFLNTVRSFLWIRVQQYTSRELQVELYRHLHGLSLRWHLGRKTGEVLRVMDRGTNSINNLLSYILFNIAPTIVDILIAIIYFTTSFNAWFGLIVFVTMVAYLGITGGVTEWRTKFRREMNTLDNNTRAKGVDSLLNFETVKYYNAEDYEVNRYRNALVDYQSAEWTSMATLSLLNSLQNIVIGGGLLAGSLFCAHLVVDPKSDFGVGDYVLFATYVLQLYQPLNFLGSYYRLIQQAFVDMENMFDLLYESQEVEDAPNAAEFRVGKSGGQIQFQNVSFNYEENKEVLKNVSFVVEPGHTVAIVGPSGGGKSTIVRLLFRFYNLKSGAILIDGQDIKQVTQQSLRSKIGVVPQDTVLFNDTIKYNIEYGRIGASQSEIEDAAKAAEIHDKILAFPQAYDTVVGERGLKLSGGEKQRVAIARTILKEPAFVLLDEATSALDSRTEKAIQGSLKRVCAGRTTVVVAHRLSTIKHANLILVLNKGHIQEQGTHEQLMENNGFYSEMWKQQLEDPSSTAESKTPSSEKSAADSKKKLK